MNSKLREVIEKAWYQLYGPMEISQVLDKLTEVIEREGVFVPNAATVPDFWTQEIKARSPEEKERIYKKVTELFESHLKAANDELNRLIEKDFAEKQAESNEIQSGVKLGGEETKGQIAPWPEYSLYKFTCDCGYKGYDPDEAKAHKCKKPDGGEKIFLCLSCKATLTYGEPHVCRNSIQGKCTCGHDQEMHMNNIGACIESDTKRFCGCLKFNFQESNSEGYKYKGLL